MPVSLLLTYATSVLLFSISLLVVVKYERLIYMLLFLVLISLILPLPYLPLIFSVTGFFVGSSINTFKTDRVGLIFVSVPIFSSLLLCLYELSPTSIIFYTSVMLIAVILLSFSYAMLVVGRFRVSYISKVLPELRFVLTPEKIVNYLNLTIVGIASADLLNNFKLNPMVSSLIEIILLISLYIFYKNVKNKKVLLATYIGGAVLAYFMLTNISISQLNEWFKFVDKVIAAWENGIYLG